jgi:hypothetical protein
MALQKGNGIFIDRQKTAMKMISNPISPDQKKISVRTAQEITYWANTFNCSVKSLGKAIIAVGYSVKDLERYLRK